MRNVHVGNHRKSRLVSGLVGAGLTALGLSGSLALTGCDTGASTTPAATAQSGAASHRQLAYFMLVDGRMGVADVLDGLKSVQTVKIGHYGVHQVAVLPDNRTIYTGNGDTKKIVKVTISEDGKSHTIKEIADTPANLHLFAANPGGSKVVMSSRLELKDTVVVPPSGLPDDMLVVIDTATDTIEKTLNLPSPAMVEFSPDGKTCFVSNVHHQSVSVVDTASWTVKDTWSVSQGGPLIKPNGELTISPDGLAASPDGKWVATADYDLHSVSVFEVANPANRRQVDYTKAPFNGVLPHDVRFSPDSKEIWVVDFAKHPDPGNEASNASIPTNIRVFDVATLELKRTIKAPVMVERTSLPQYAANSAYLTTAVGGVVEIDRKTGNAVNQIVVGGVGTPVVCGMAMY